MFRSMTCFKAYDIRGRLGEELDEEVAYRIGRAYAQLLQPRGVVVGGDARHSSAALKAALARGLMEGAPMCTIWGWPAPRRSILPPST